MKAWLARKLDAEPNELHLLAVVATVLTLLLCLTVLVWFGFETDRGFLPLLVAVVAQLFMLPPFVWISERETPDDVLAYVAVPAFLIPTGMSLAWFVGGPSVLYAFVLIGIGFVVACFVALIMAVWGRRYPPAKQEADPQFVLRDEKGRALLDPAMGWPTRRSL